MDYDPVKRELGTLFNRYRWSRILLYRLLNILLLRSWHVRRAMKRWARSAPPHSAILDAGAGLGQYVRSASRLKGKHTVTGVDIKEDETSVNRRLFETEKGRVEFRVADLNTYVMPEKYNLILCVDVMEHIEDDTGVMRNLCRSLAPGGTLMISTPSDQGGSDAHHEDDQSFISEHVRNGYSIEDITSKLHSAGFAGVEVQYTYGKPGHLSWILSMKYPILMLGRSRFFYLLLPFYYLLTFPLALLLNYLDTVIKHRAGTGLMVIARKESA